MTQQHPISPPEELVASMIEQAFGPLGATGLSDKDRLTAAFADLVTRAAQWGANQELEACCEWLDGVGDLALQLRADRRPKPPSLKEQALAAAAELEGFKGVDIIRRALEQLP